MEGKLDWGGVASGVEWVFLVFWAEMVHRCLWWNVEVAGCVAVNWVLGEEAGRSVSELGEFGRLVRTVVLGRQGSL